MQVTWYVRVCTQLQWHGPATVWLTSEQPGNVIPVPKTFTLLVVRCLSQCDAASLCLLALIYCIVCQNFLTLHFLHPLKQPEGSCELQSNVFEMDIRDGSQLHALCFLPYQLANSPPVITGIKLTAEINTRTFLSNVTHLQKSVFFVSFECFHPSANCYFYNSIT